MTSPAAHEIEWTPEKSARLWDYYAGNPSIRQQYFGWQAGRAVAALVDRVVGLRSAGRILDVSCGLGDVLAALQPHLGPEGRLFGIDPSPASIAAVRARFAGAAPVVTVECVPRFPAPFDAASFDLILATEVIEHLDDAEGEILLSECRRLLSPGGHLVVTTPNDEDYDASKTCCPECGCIFHRWQHRRTWSAETLRRSLESAGFQTVLVTPIAWNAVETSDQPLWKRLARRVLAPLRTPPPQTGLVYVGRVIAPTAPANGNSGRGL